MDISKKKARKMKRSNKRRWAGLNLPGTCIKNRSWWKIRERSMRVCGGAGSAGDIRGWRRIVKSVGLTSWNSKVILVRF
jgi:hypothetical protein